MMLEEYQKLSKIVEEFDSGLLEIIPDAIVDEYASQAMRYSIYFQHMTKAQRLAENAKANIEIIYANADSYVRDSFARAGVKSTENSVRQAILSQEDYIQANEFSANCDYVFRSLQGIVKAYEQRRDMIAGMGSFLRQEFNS